VVSTDQLYSTQNLNCHCFRYHTRTQENETQTVTIHWNKLIVNLNVKCNKTRMTERYATKWHNRVSVKRHECRHTKLHINLPANYLHRFDHIYWKNAHQNQRRQRTFLCQLDNKILNSLTHDCIQVSTWTWNDVVQQLADRSTTVDIYDMRWDWNMHEKQAGILLNDRSTTQDKNTKAVMLQWQRKSLTTTLHIQRLNDEHCLVLHVCYSDRLFTHVSWTTSSIHLLLTSGLTYSGGPAVSAARGKLTFFAAPPPVNTI